MRQKASCDASDLNTVQQDVRGELRNITASCASVVGKIHKGMAGNAGIIKRQNFRADSLNGLVTFAGDQHVSPSFSSAIACCIALSRGAISMQQDSYQNGFSDFGWIFATWIIIRHNDLIGS